MLELLVLINDERRRIGKLVRDFDCELSVRKISKNWVKSKILSLS